MKKILFITVAFICSFLILFLAKKDLMADPGGFQKCKLTKLWETKADLRIPESVLYNPSEDIIYVSNINGKPTEKNKLIIGNSGDGSLKAISFITKEISIIAKIGSGIDGVQSDGKGNYFTSDWRGKTSYVTSSGKVTVLLNTTNQKINSADIEYIENKHILLIPTFFNNRVVAYQAEEG